MKGAGRELPAYGHGWVEASDENEEVGAPKGQRASAVSIRTGGRGREVAEGHCNCSTRESGGWGCAEGKSEAERPGVSRPDTGVRALRSPSATAPRGPQEVAVAEVLSPW